MKLVKYSAVWCGPCKTFTPVVDEVTQELGIDLEEVDIEKTPTPGIMGVPTIRLVNDNGDILGESVGAMSANDLRGWIEAHFK